MGYIYLITNRITGKQYVGQSQCEDIEKRWNQHRTICKYSLGRLIFNTYKKYGIENFKFQLICICFDEDCDNYEIEYIKKYNTLAPHGYNLTEGGKSAKHSEETRKLMSEKIKLAATPEWRKQISERQKGEKHFGYGKHLPDAQKEKMSEKRKLYWKNLSDEQYQKICEERKQSCNIDLLEGTIQGRAKGLEIGRAKLRKRVGKYTLNNELIEEYSSLLEAATKNNLHHCAISKVCKQIKGYSQSGGFLWKFI